MSGTSKAKDSKKEPPATETQIAQIVIDDLLADFLKLHRACQAVMKCRDLVLQDGTRKNMMMVYDLLEAALDECDSFAAIAELRDEHATQTFCSVHQTFFSRAEEAAGMCFSCQAEREATKLGC